jgi:regulatory protein
MKITAIKAQVKNPERVSIYVDEKYAFSLNHAQLLDLKVRIGLEIDDARLAEFKKASELGKAYERALNYAMIRPRSVKELQDYCRRKKWAPEDCQTIIDKLVARRYVDDRNFARAWVESRAMANKTSQRKLRLELKQKGVADDIIAEALQNADFDEGSALRALIAKKRRLARYQDEQKLMQFLARQGFSFDDIKEALKED